MHVLFKEIESSIFLAKFVNISCIIHDPSNAPGARQSGIVRHNFRFNFNFYAGLRRTQSGFF